METQKMFGTQTVHSDESAAETNAFGRNTLERARIDSHLPQTMGLQEDRIPYVPNRLSLLPKNALPATLAQQAQCLASPQAMGGHEKLINANRDAILTRAQNALADTLSAGDASAKYAEVIQQVRDVAVGLRASYEASLSAVEKRLAVAEETLRRYQDESAKTAGKSTNLVDALRQFLGDYVKGPDAIRAYNAREMLVFERDCHRAAMEVIAQIIAMCERLLAGMETTRAAALAGALEARQHIETLRRQADARGRKADYQVNIERVIESIQRQETIAAYLPQLIAEARDNGGEKLAQVALEIARHLAATEYDPLDIVALMRREAACTPLNGKSINPEHAPLLVGGRVLDITRRKRQSLRLTDDARPREFVLQVSADMRPLFGHPSLVAARFRKPRNAFAFVRVQTDVALDELQVMREGEADFREELNKREFFIFEEIAQTWRDAKASSIAQDDKAAYSPIATTVLAAEEITTPSANGNRA